MLEMKARVEAPEGTDKSGSTRVRREMKSTSDHFCPGKFLNKVAKIYIA